MDLSIYLLTAARDNFFKRPFLAAFSTIFVRMKMLGMRLRLDKLVVFGCTMLNGLLTISNFRFHRENMEVGEIFQMVVLPVGDDSG